MLDMLTIDGREKVLALGPAFLLPEDKEIAWAGAKDHVVNRWDFGWVMGNFIQLDVDGSGASANRNGHVFDLAQCRTRHQTIRMSPVNMLHRDHHNIGTFAATEIIDPRTGEKLAASVTALELARDMRDLAKLTDASSAPLPFPYVEALAALWKYQCPGEYRAVKEAHASGHAFFSMEAIPKAFTCLTPACCGKTYPYDGLKSDSYCATLRKSGSPKRLEEPTFVGGAMVIPPAQPGWSRAELKQVAGLVHMHADEAQRVYEQLAATTDGLEAEQCEDLVLVLLAAAFAGEDPDIAVPVAFDWDGAMKRLLADVAPDDGDDKAPKDRVDYRPAEDPERQCATCMHFKPESRSCMLVEGDIDPAATCDEWTINDPLLPNGVPSTPADMLARRAAKAEADAGVLIAAGLAVVAQDSGRVLLIQRAVDDTDPASGRWEFPGGHIEAGEAAFDAAKREWTEEVGCVLPDGRVTGTWTSPNGIYQGFVYVVPGEGSVACNLDPDKRNVLNPDDPDSDNIEIAAWFDVAHLPGMPALRDEARTTDWTLLVAAPTSSEDLTDDDLDFRTWDPMAAQAAAIVALVTAHESAPANSQSMIRAKAVDIAALLGDAALIPAQWAEREALYDADYSTAERAQMAKDGKAMPGGRYPIGDGDRGVEDLKNAIHAVGRGKGSHDAIRRHIVRNAKRLGQEALIPEGWNSQ